MKIKKEKCGHITIIGETNVGKSTLLNQIIGKKISITSRKKNTTQSNIIGIITKKLYQSIYIDTPGIIFDCKNNVIQYRKNYFYKTIKQSALIIFMIDKLCWTEKNEIILKKIRNNKVSIILIINKIDKFKDKNILLPFIEYIKKKNVF